MARHSKIPKAQRPELVLAVLRGMENLEVLARRHQNSANTLRRWRDESLAGGRERLMGTGGSAAVQGENKRLQHDLAEREMIIGELNVANPSGSCAYRLFRTPCHISTYDLTPPATWLCSASRSQGIRRL